MDTPLAAPDEVVAEVPAAPRTPAQLRDQLAQELAGDPDLPDLLARWDRWGPDLLAGVDVVYPDPTLASRLVDLIAAGHLARSRALRDFDRERLLRPDWFQRSDAIGYQAYTERFAGNLRGVIDRIDYLQDLGVTYLHLMPLLQPRPGANDGGYAVMDYDQIRADLGTMEDLSELTGELHKAGISLALDLILNHVAYEHRWAQAARDGDPHYQRYFWAFEDRQTPDAFDATVTEVFPHTAPGNFTFDPDLQRWVWTTFHTWQWDLNWSNPDVLFEFASIIVNLANRGVDCLRLDAIAFLWKRLGTNCQNQPEVHAITQILRAVARIVAPAMIFKAEAIVGPDDLVHYLGTGQHAGRVSDMAYHNSLMVQIWSALAARDARLLAVALSEIPDLPTTAAWATYLRCHDDIGWAIDDADATAVGWDGPAHRHFLSEFYTGAFEGSFAQGETFQQNLVTGDRRVNGTAASLAGLGLGDPLAVDRLLLAHAMVLGYAGLPIIYMGDELGLLNDHSYLAEPAHADDSRWVHRPHMPGEPATGDAAELNSRLRHLIRLRKDTESLHASVPTRVVRTSHPAVVCFVRRHPAGDLVQVYNVADHPVRIPASDIPTPTQELVSGTVPQAVDGAYELPAYAVWWLT